MFAFRICAAVLLSAVCVQAAETISVDPQVEKRAETLPSISTVDERPLRAVLEYMSTVSGITIRINDPKLERLLVSTNSLMSSKPTTWREVLEPICRQHKLRIDDSRLKEKIVTLYKPEFVNLSFNNADLREAIMALATSGNLNVVLDNEVTGTITARLTDITHEEALDILVKTAGYVAVRDKTGTVKIY
jgi:type II secretory pathway component HofQ